MEKVVNKILTSICLAFIACVSLICFSSCGSDITMEAKGANYVNDTYYVITYYYGEVEVTNFSEKAITYNASDFSIKVNNETLTGTDFISGYHAHSSSISGATTEVLKSQTRTIEKNYTGTLQICFEVTSVDAITDIYYKGKKINS